MPGQPGQGGRQKRDGDDLLQAGAAQNASIRLVYIVSHQGFRVINCQAPRPRRYASRPGAAATHHVGARATLVSSGKRPFVRIVRLSHAPRGLCRASRLDRLGVCMEAAQKIRTAVTAVSLLRRSGGSRPIASGGAGTGQARPVAAVRGHLRGPAGRRALCCGDTLFPGGALQRQGLCRARRAIRAHRGRHRKLVSRSNRGHCGRPWRNCTPSPRSWTRQWRSPGWRKATA